MIAWIITAKPLGGNRVRLEFNDGLRGEVNSDLDTIVRPNGADFAPEFLHQRVQNSAAEVAEP